MTKPEPASNVLSMPVLLRHARVAYAASMRMALEAAGYDDIPKNGLYVIGGLAHQSGAHPLSQLIDELRLSKQAAGQLVDTLVTRGYLKRDVDADDRRRFTIGLTERGHSAASVLMAAGAKVDEDLRSRIEPNDLERTRLTLGALIEIGRSMLGKNANQPTPDRRSLMEIADTRKALRVDNSDLSESTFTNVKLASARFEDVNLQGSSFADINLADASFLDVNLSRVTIKDANLTGMTINGVLVSDLIRAHRNRPQAVLYAKNLKTLQAFYQGVFLFELEHAEADHAVLASPDCRLILVQIPESIASTIAIASPPKRRTETPIKLVFAVASISAARNLALALGGEVDPADREWSFQGSRVCDGHDPEGNVVQCRQREQISRLP